MYCWHVLLTYTTDMYCWHILWTYTAGCWQMYSVYHTAHTPVMCEVLLTACPVNCQLLLWQNGRHQHWWRQQWRGPNVTSTDSHSTVVTTKQIHFIILRRLNVFATTHLCFHWFFHSAKLLSEAKFCKSEQSWDMSHVTAQTASNISPNCHRSNACQHGQNVPKIDSSTLIQQRRWHFNVTSVIKELNGRPSVDQCTGQC